METVTPLREESPHIVPGENPGPLSEKPAVPRPLRGAVNLAVALILALSLLHMAMVFLHVAPTNTISQRYSDQIDGWIYPYFEQDWRLFAPNPDSANRDIEVRTRRTAVDGTVEESGWFDLTALDTSAVRHDVFPSHTAQNTLRRAWSAYLDANGTDDRTNTDRARMMRRYLRDIAVHRLAKHRPGSFDAVQLRVSTRPITAGAPRRVPSNAAEIRYLPWWKVASDAR